MVKTFDHKDTQENRLYINLEKPQDYKHTILWSYGGMYSLIPLARIKNLMQEYQDKLQSPDVPHSCLVTLRYSNCVPVDPEVARALIGE